MDLLIKNKKYFYLFDNLLKQYIYINIKKKKKNY